MISTDVKQQEIVTLSRFQPFIQASGDLIKSIKKEKIWQSFFQLPVEWISKNLWKMISSDVKANKNIK